MKSLISCLLALALVGPGLYAEETPELPDAKEKVEDAPEVQGEAKELATPEEEPDPSKESVKATPQKPARFRFKNMIFGGLGGAVFGGGIAILFFSKNDKDGSLDPEKVRTNGAIGAGGGALLGGLLGFLLGATTPTGPLPPEMQTNLEPPLFAGPHVAFSMQF